MDALTFAMVMIQIRVFKSPYFQHARQYLTVLIETSAQGLFWFFFVFVLLFFVVFYVYDTFLEHSDKRAYHDY